MHSGQSLFYVYQIPLSIGQNKNKENKKEIEVDMPSKWLIKRVDYSWFKEKKAGSIYQKIVCFLDNSNCSSSDVDIAKKKWVIWNKFRHVTRVLAMFLRWFLLALVQNTAL